MRSRSVPLLTLCLFIICSACAKLDQTLSTLQLPVTNSVLNERTIAAGLKEALQVGTVG